MLSPTPRTTLISPTSAGSISAGLMRRPARSRCIETPTKSSGPRRGMMDTQDRLWFGEYRGNKIAMFDTKSEKFQEWAMPTPWSNPYDVAIDKNGEAWTGSMLNDRIARLDPKSGQFTEYVLPKSTNIRQSVCGQFDDAGHVLGG